MSDVRPYKRRAFIARRFLQGAVIFGSLVPVLAGLAGVLLGPDMVETHHASSLAMDSHYRYLSGLLVGIGCGFLSTLSNIENQTARFRLLTAIVFLGGLSRLYSLIIVGIPDPGMLFGLTMELVITPLLALGQTVVARLCVTHSHINS